MQEADERVLAGSRVGSFGSFIPACTTKSVAAAEVLVTAPVDAVDWYIPDFSDGGLDEAPVTETPGERHQRLVAPQDGARADLGVLVLRPPLDKGQALGSAAQDATGLVVATSRTAQAGAEPRAPAQRGR